MNVKTHHFSRPFSFLLLFALATLLAANAPAVGSVTPWGGGQPNPAGPLSGIVAISTSVDHSLALRSDGTVTAWGWNFDSQLNVPAGLANVKAVAAGEYFSIALKTDGTVVGWGTDEYGQIDIPAGLSGVTAVSAGHAHCLALKSDGTVVAWGSNVYGQTNVPPGLSGVVSVLAAWNYSVAVKSDGTVVAWGVNDDGQTSVPGGLTGVTSVAGNQTYCLARKSDGTVVAWGSPPSLPEGWLSGINALAAGETHSLALKNDGTILAWGSDASGETELPLNLSAATAISAGWHYSVALVGGVPVFLLTNPRWSPNTFTVSLQSQSGATYTLEYKTDLTSASWTSLGSVLGNGSVITLSDNSATPGKRFYRVSAHP